MAAVSNSTSMPVNVSNGNLEKAVQSDASVQSGSAVVGKGSVEVENGVDPGTASKPTNTGDIWVDDPAKRFPIGDDLFE